MQDTLQTTKIFVRVVEQNSFAAAARSLLVDPSVVSRAIGALERELGVPLFRRSTRSLQLTTQGAQFYRDCLQILQRFAEATQRFKRDSAIVYGQLKVGMAPGLRRRLLLRAIPRFQQQYPQIDLTLVNVNDRAEIGDKSVDVVVRVVSVRHGGTPRSEASGLIVRRLFQPRYVVCASKAYLDRAGYAATPTDLLKYPCVGHISLERDVAKEWRFAKSSQSQTVRVTPKLLVQGAEAICEACLAGCGIARTITPNVDDELRTGVLVPLLPDWECTGAPPVIAVYRKTRPIVPQVGLFVRYLADAFRHYDIRSNARTIGEQ